jgi:hypothetical protein
MTKPTKPHGRGALHLVLIATATALPGCADDPADMPEPMTRAGYDTQQACVQDWGSEEDCEPGSFDPQGMDGVQAQGGHGSSGGSGFGSSYGHRWWGPYFSRSGTVYRYDGREQWRGARPLHAAVLREQVLSARQVFNTPGRYATTPVHAQSGRAKLVATGRGGFGGIGRGFTGGG